MADRIGRETTGITTLDDPRVAGFGWLSSPEELPRRGLMVLEGRLVLDRAVARGRPALSAVLVTPAAADALGTVLARVPAHVPVFVAPQALMNGIAGFNIHRGCLALATRPALPMLEHLPIDGIARIVVMEGVSNPDNVGGLLRNAAAFGVDLVVLGPGCGDPFYRKAVRTSMGAALHVPMALAGPWPDALAHLRAAGLDVWALTPGDDGEPMRTLEVPDRVALVVGAEGTGLSEAARAAASRRVRIEMADPDVDSLNVATAAAVALWWTAAR